MMFFASSVCTPASDLHLHLAAALQRGEARDALHLGALQQELDAFGMLVDDPVLALLHLGIVEPRVFARGCRPGSELTKCSQTSAVWSRALGGNTAHQQTGSAEFGLLFDQALFSVRTGRRGWLRSSRRDHSRSQSDRKALFLFYIRHRRRSRRVSIFDEKPVTRL